MEDDNRTIISKLYNQYIKTNGKTLKSFICDMEYVADTWNKLNVLLDRGIIDFLHVKGVYYIDSYLIIRLNFADYLIIDINTEKIVTTGFQANFFIENCEENKAWNKIDTYNFQDYNYDVTTLLNFCMKNKDILEDNRIIEYEIKYEEAKACLIYNYIRGYVLLKFMDNEQILIDQMIFDLDLKIIKQGNSAINETDTLEIIDNIDNVKIPYSNIPQKYINDSKDKVKRLFK